MHDNTRDCRTRFAITFQTSQLSDETNDREFPVLRASSQRVARSQSKYMRSTLAPCGGRGKIYSQHSNFCSVSRVGDSQWPPWWQPFRFGSRVALTSPADSFSQLRFYVPAIETGAVVSTGRSSHCRHLSLSLSLSLSLRSMYRENVESPQPQRYWQHHVEEKERVQLWGIMARREDHTHIRTIINANDW